MEFGAIGSLQLADPLRRNDSLHQSAEDAAHPDIDLEHVQLLVAVRRLDLERDIGYTNDLRPNASMIC